MWWPQSHVPCPATSHTPSPCHHLLCAIISRQSSANSLFYYIPPREKKLLASNLTTPNLFVAFFLPPLSLLFALTILHCLGLLRSLGVSGFVHSSALVLSDLSAWLLARTLFRLQTILFHFTSLSCQLRLALTMLHICFLHFSFQKKERNA